MTDLTGFRFGKGDHAWGPLMHITDFEHPITRGLPQDLFWGTNSRIGPLFHLEDPEARRSWARWSTRWGAASRALGSRDCSRGRGMWTSIYIAAPNVPAPVLRGIAR